MFRHSPFFVVCTSAVGFLAFSGIEPSVVPIAKLLFYGFGSLSLIGLTSGVISALRRP